MGMEEMVELVGIWRIWWWFKYVHEVECSSRNCGEGARELPFQVGQERKKGRKEERKRSKFILQLPSPESQPKMCAVEMIRSWSSHNRATITRLVVMAAFGKRS